MADQITLDLNVSLSTDNAKREFTNMLNSMSSNTEAANRKINAALGGKEQKVVDIQYNPDTRQWESKERLMLSLVDKLNRTKAKADQIDRNSLTSLKGQVREATQVRDAISRTVINTNAYGKAVRSANPAWQDANTKVTMLNRKIADASGNWTKMITSRIPGGQNIMNLANGLTQVGFAAQAAWQAIQLINQAIQPLINRTRQIQGLDMALQGFGLSAQQSAQFMNNAKVQALTYGTSLNKLESGYKRIAPAVLAAGGSMNDVSMAMASIAARTTTLGLNTAQAGRYMEAFAQVMGKGKLQGEELTQQFSELDGSLRSSLQSYFAANNGITNLEQAMQKGEVTSGMFLKAFVAISQEMRTNLAGGLDSIQQRLDSMNVAQVEQLKQTLNTISLDALNQAFAGVGRQFQQMGVFISQLTSTILNDMPRTLDALGKTLELVGFVLQGLLVLAGFITRVFFIALEGFIAQFYDAANAIKAFVEAIPGGKQLLDGIAQGAQNVVKGLQWMTDQWLDVADAAGVSEQKLSNVDGRIVMLSNKLRNGKISVMEYRTELDRIGKEVQLQNLSTQLTQLNAQVVQLKKDIQLATQEKAQTKSVFDAEKKKLDDLKSAVKSYFDDQRTQLEAKKTRTTQAYDREIADIKRAQTAVKNRQEAEMSALKARNQAMQQAISAEISALQAKTPAEQKLATMREQEIRDKLRSTELSEKEKIELTAQLERIDRTKKIEEQQLQLKQAKANAQKQEAAMALKHKTEQEQLKNAEKQAMSNKKKALGDIDKELDAIKKKEEAIAGLYKDSTTEIDLQKKSFSDIQTMVRDQVTATRNAETAYRNSANEVSRLKTNLQNAQYQARNLQTTMERVANAAFSARNSMGQMKFGPGYAAGGNISGGTVATVNELGQEGFLSSSGKMSEIKAPSWGQWKAPSSGTVIPAHIWAQVKAQQTAGGGGTIAMPSAAGMGSGVLSAIRSINTGSQDVVTNNVTIQSQDPERTLAQSLVSLRRTKRARYH